MICIESNCSHYVLMRKIIFFLFVAYTKGEIVIFIPAAYHSEKQECSNIVAIFSMLSGWKMGLLISFFVNGIVAFSPVYQPPGLFLKSSPSSLILHHVGISWYGDSYQDIFYNSISSPESDLAINLDSVLQVKACFHCYKLQLSYFPEGNVLCRHFLFILSGQTTFLSLTFSGYAALSNNLAQLYCSTELTIKHV